MALRKFDPSDLDACIDMYLDFMNALENGDEDPWTENAVAERLRNILENPAFQGWVLEEHGVTLGFSLGVSFYAPQGRSFDVMELFCASNQDVRVAAARMLADVAKELKSEGYARVKVLSRGPWTPDFFIGHGFVEDKNVRLLELTL